MKFQAVIWYVDGLLSRRELTISRAMFSVNVPQQRYGILLFSGRTQH